MQDIVAYLQTNIIGRTLYTAELQYGLEGGAIEGVYSDQMTFSNLTYSATGVQFDLLVVSRERLYEMENGRQKALRKDFSSVSHFRYELARRLSTGGITGFMRFVAASLYPVPAEAMASAVFDCILKENELSWKEREMLYRDQPASGGGHLPVTFEAKCRFFLEDGKARYEYDGVCLDVDPHDLSRTPSAATYPKFVAREP